jgi:hypothetical protein
MISVDPMQVSTDPQLSTLVIRKPTAEALRSLQDSSAGMSQQELLTDRRTDAFGSAPFPR